MAFFLGIAIGVAALIVVTSVMNGFKVDLLDKYSSAKGHIVSVGLGSRYISDYTPVVQSIGEIDNVLYAIPSIEQEALAINDRATHGVMIYGISKGDLQTKTFISQSLAMEDIDNFNATVFISKKLSNILHAGVGDTITLFVPNAINTPFGPVQREENFTIGGIFDTGLYEYDMNYVIMPLKDMQTFLELDDVVTGIEILLKNQNHLQKTSYEILHRYCDKLKVMSFLHSERGVFQVLQVQKNIMSLILLIVILVAAFNIVSSLTMLSNSKSKDIAILNTIGATRCAILRMFLYIGSIIGVCGSVVGVIFGILISRNIAAIQSWIEKTMQTQLFDDAYFLSSKLPSALDVMSILIIFISAITICVLSAIYPSIKSSRLNPIQVLKS